MDIDCRREDGSLCIECCKWTTFIVVLIQDSEKQLEFYHARGCKIAKLSGDNVAITLPTVCPQLTTNGCQVQGAKPKVCWDYDCRHDPFLKDGKYFIDAIVEEVKGYGMHEEKEKEEEEEKEVKQVTLANGSTIDIVPEHKKRFPITLQEE